MSREGLPYALTVDGVEENLLSETDDILSDDKKKTVSTQGERIGNGGIDS